MITQDRLKELVSYSKSSGEFAWKNQRGKNKAGTRAGSDNSNGYRYIKLDQKQYREHRLVWLYVCGSHPENQIDHINGIKDDNRIANLRAVDVIGNHRNMPISKNNKSGFIGVSWYKRDSAWQAGIKIKGKQISLGRFENLSDAVRVRISAEIEYSFHINHGAR
tara:strand:- start:44 stop:535 length:492 start_codon:yes stop_codon:yes gene_type:complete